MKALVGPLAAVGLVAYLAVRGLLAYVADGRTVAAALLPAGLVLGGAVLVFGLLSLSADRARRTYRYRMDPGGAPRDTIDHEVAHVEVGNRHGGRTVAGRVYPDGSGWVDVRLPRGASTAQEIAVDMAGSIGEGRDFYTSPHAHGDRTNAAARVAHLPQAERDEVYREAERIARPGFWHAGSGAAVRRALSTTGSYR